MNLEQQHAILDKTYKQLTEFCGKPPRGSVAPWWESSKEGAELMLKYGVEYGIEVPSFCVFQMQSVPRLSWFLLQRIFISAFFRVSIREIKIV